jgi:hypothetical protein
MDFGPVSGSRVGRDPKKLSRRNIPLLSCRSLQSQTSWSGWSYVIAHAIASPSFSVDPVLAQEAQRRMSTPGGKAN